MRYLGLAAIGLLAACGAPSANKAKESVAALEAGQYEVTSEVTQFRKADEGKPRINTPVGTRTTRSVCVSDGAALPPDLFADEGLTCQDGASNYARNGRLNLNVRCTRPDLKGDLGYTVSGTFDAQSFRADRQLNTIFSTDGDVIVGATVQGRRTGACTAPAAPAAPAGQKSK
jgi:hypothetical protein